MMTSKSSVCGRRECVQLLRVAALLLVLASSAFSQSEPVISKIGDYNVDTSIVIPKQDVFLLSGSAESPGIIFAYRARIVNNDAMLVLQLWRPSANDTSIYQLIDSVYYSPSSTGQVDIYVGNLGRQCVHIQRGDRIGIYNINSTGVVPYTIETSAQAHRSSSGTVQAGREISFDKLAYRVVFGVAAYAVNSANGNADAMVECPDVQIPDETTRSTTTTTILPPTGPPGDTGVPGDTGPRGEQGNKGSIGLTGPSGDTGSVGSTGAIGKMGNTGASGSPGATGFTGNAGYTGDTGDVGVTGLVGVVGATGSRGDTGKDAEAPPETGRATDERWWRKEWLIKGVFIWLGVVSLLALVALIWSIVLCALWCSLKSKAERHSRTRHSFINAYPVK